MKQKKYDYLMGIVNNNADVLAGVQSHSAKTRSKMYFWVCVGAIAGYFLETQIENLDARLKRLENKEDHRDDIVDFEEWTDKENIGEE